ncbi:MAG: hypothetical protein DRH04_00335 [Deltaproteobacteria bacterium]|nr:MAG: hypothetical protein DRH04_00335 [Deltaproteobacteria bacterium]
MEVLLKQFDRFTALVLEGVFDAAQVSGVLQTAGDVLQQEKRDLVVDGSGLSFVDSSGLGCFVSIYKQAQNQGRSFVLVGFPAPIVEVITITKLDRILSIYPGTLESYLAESDSHAG